MCLDVAHALQAPAPAAPLLMCWAGAAGIFLTGEESVYLTRRKGFVRMAIQAGAGAGAARDLPA